MWFHRESNKNEEERFHETLSDGLLILEEIVKTAKQEGRNKITGSEAFKLYDTYGFPFDLTVDYANESGLCVDEESFNSEMEDQRNRARAARQDVDSMHVQGGVIGEIKDKSYFIGYNELVTKTSITHIIVENQLMDTISEGVKAQLLLEKTPFYAESGGEVADTGLIIGEDGQTLKVTNVWKAPNGQHVHQVEVIKGSFKVGDSIKAEIDKILRNDITKNHTATHILHKALKRSFRWSC